MKREPRKPLIYKPRVPNAYVLRGEELRLVRLALDEAACRIASALDSGLPPDPEDYDRRDKALKRKWTARVAAYDSLLFDLGGFVRRQDTSDEILYPRERK